MDVDDDDESFELTELDNLTLNAAYAAYAFAHAPPEAHEHDLDSYALDDFGDDLLGTG